MIPEGMIVAADGRTAGSLADRATVDAMNVDTGDMDTAREVRRFGDLATHQCHRLRTLHGCEVVLSNNALVWPERGGYINIQRAAERGDRIMCLLAGALAWEPIVESAPDAALSVVSLVVPGGLLAVGRDASLRIFTPGNFNAAPNTAR